MNHVSQMQNLLYLNKRYTDFLPLCPAKDAAKLRLEIHKQSARISFINNMSIEEAKTEIHCEIEIRQSKLNFLK